MYMIVLLLVRFVPWQHLNYKLLNFLSSINDTAQESQWFVSTDDNYVTYLRIYFISRVPICYVFFKSTFVYLYTTAIYKTTTTAQKCFPSSGSNKYSLHSPTCTDIGGLSCWIIILRGRLSKWNPMLWHANKFYEGSNEIGMNPVKQSALDF